MEEQNISNKRHREEDEATAESIKIRKKCYCCSKCDLMTSSAVYFKNHVANHGSKQRFTCPDCDFSNNRIQGVAMHMKLLHTGQASSSNVQLFGIVPVIPIFISARQLLKSIFLCRNHWSCTM